MANILCGLIMYNTLHKIAKNNLSCIIYVGEIYDTIKGNP